jgi:tetratricopeptide (TPR) repeat protein
MSGVTRTDLLARLTAARERREAGDYSGAADLLRVAIADAEAGLGPAAVELSALLNELGIVGKYSGGFVEAEIVYRRALAIEDRAGRSAGANAASILHNLAGLAHARGDAEAALALAVRGIDIRAALPEPDPSGLAEDRAALAAILIDLGRYVEARVALVDLIDSGAPRYDVAVALHNLGSLRYREGDTVDAAAILRRSVKLKSAILGRRHPDLAVTLYNLSRCLQTLGKPRRARRHLTRAVAILDGTVAADHPTLVACLRKLAER